MRMNPSCLQIRRLAVVVLGLCSVSCGTTAQHPALKPAAAAAPVNPLAGGRGADMQLGGKVIRVNADLGYVVVECAVLPNAEEEAKVVRGGNEVGRVRFSGPVAFPYATADVVSGQPMAGDRIRQ